MENRKWICTEHLYLVLLSLYMFFTMAVPYSLNLIRMMLLVMVTAVSLYGCRFRIHGEGLKVMAVFLAYNGFSFLYGILRSPKGAVVEFRAEILWPVFFLAAMQLLADEKRLLNLIRVMVWIEFAISVFDFLAVACSYMHVSVPFFTEFISLPFLQVEPGVPDVYFWFRFWHMSTHIFMIPFTIALFIMGGYDRIIKKPLMFLLLFMQGVNVFTSQRSALMAVFILAVPVSLAAGWYLAGKNRERTQIILKFFFVMFLGIILIAAFNRFLPFDFWDIIRDRIIDKIFRGKDIIAGDIRQRMHRALLRGWMGSPLTGWGMGTYTEEVQRDAVNKWFYESYYHAMLFKKGLAGVILYAVFHGWIFWKLFCMMKRNKASAVLLIPVVTGLFCMLAASSEDRYLQTLGNMWTVFIPFAIANHGKRIICADNTCSDTGQKKGVRF